MSSCDDATRIADFNRVVICCKAKEAEPERSNLFCTKTVALCSKIVRMLSTVSGTVLNLKAGPLIPSLAWLKTGRMSVRIKSVEASFQHGLSRLLVHAVHEAAMNYSVNYSTILPTFII